jgi:3-oxoacyl-[acyl-carrier protein] reductase
MKNFRNKTVIITGGARGIGKGCCLAFAKEGANIVFTYSRSGKEAAALQKEIGKTAGAAIAMRADVRDIGQCRAVVEKTLNKFGRIDVLVNNAGIKKDRPLFMMTDDEWKDVIETNLGGVYNMTRAVITTMMKQKAGCIINMSSVSGLSGLAGQTNYSASKAGIIGFTKSLAKEVAGYGIRVNAVCPGFVETDMVSAVREDIKKSFVAAVPMKRMGEVAEVAEMCVFLASPKAGYVTGETIRIDGGLAI